MINYVVEPAKYCYSRMHVKNWPCLTDKLILRDPKIRHVDGSVQLLRM